jgi:hypothetical protein
MATAMEPTSAAAGPTEVSIQIQVALARRMKDQQRFEGAQAVRLIEGATPSQRPLPPDATISIRA